MKVGAIIQARMSSTRLAGKVKKELPYGSGITVLQQIIRRLGTCKNLNDIIVATTKKKDDSEIVSIAERENSNWFRGSEADVLKRYFLAAKRYKLDVIVRITGDCPCIDSRIVDSYVEKHIRTSSDYTTNLLTRTYPRGLDTEVISFETLERTYKNAKAPQEKEHVVVHYIQRNPQLFKITEIKARKKLYAPDLRLTIDTQEDYALLCAVFGYLYPQDNYFDSHQIMDLLARKPWLRLINKKVVHKNYSFSSLKEEIREGVNLLDLQGLKKASNLLKRHLSK